MTPEQGYTLDFLDLSRLPAISAVYAVWCVGDCLYVGQSKDIRKRWETHHMGMLCLRHGADRVTWVPTEPADLLSSEKQYIAQLRPKLNGRGRETLQDSGIDGIYMEGGTIAVSNDAMRKLATSDLRRDGIRLAFEIMRRMNQASNLVHCSNDEYARELGISNNAISKLIPRLTKIGFIHRAGTKLVMVNPNWCFRGTPEQHHAAIQSWQALHPIGIVPKPERKTA